MMKVYTVFTLFLAITVHGLDEHSKLDMVVHAAECINNSTHCHCSLKSPGENSQCIKPVPSESGKCQKGPCAKGFQCDCGSGDVCELVSTKYYRVAETPKTKIFSCIEDHKVIPRKLVARTSDFHIIAYQEFQLFVNDEEIGYGETNTAKTFTVEIHSGDVIGLIARRQSNSEYGIKLRFIDADEETRVIDENWYASPTFASSWLDQSFDPDFHGWKHPSTISTNSFPGFDPNVPWMWLDDGDTVYFRYVLP